MLLHARLIKDYECKKVNIVRYRKVLHGEKSDKSRPSVNAKIVKLCWKISAHSLQVLKYIVCLEYINNKIEINILVMAQHLLMIVHSGYIQFVFYSSHLHVFICMFCVHISVCVFEKRRSWILLLMNGIHRKQFIS